MLQISDLVIAVISFILTFFLILLIYPISIKFGLVDHPGGRKRHKKTVPLIGGIAIFLSLSVIFLIKGYFANFELSFFWLASCILIFSCIVDDKSPLNHYSRFIFQALALTIVIFAGHTKITSLGWMFGSKEFILGIFSAPFTYFAVIGVINAVNMSDGLDGLAASVGLSQVALLLFYALQINSIDEIGIALIIAGALLAFLIFNFPNRISEKFKVFLGDSGSMLLGFSLAWLCVRLGHTGQKYPPVLMLWIMALPIMDAIYLIINRRLRGVSPFKSDRRHLHHILQLYFSEKQTVIIMFFVSILIGLLGGLLYRAGVSELVMFLVFLFLFATYFSIASFLRVYALTRPPSIRYIS